MDEPDDAVLVILKMSPFLGGRPTKTEVKEEMTTLGATLLYVIHAFTLPTSS